MIPDKNLILPWAKESIDAFIETGRPLGSFLEAVVSNDLKESIGRADHVNLPNIPHIVAYLYNCCPIGSWGSKANMETWQKEAREKYEQSKQTA